MAAMHHNLRVKCNHLYPIWQLCMEWIITKKPFPPEDSTTIGVPGASWRWAGGNVRHGGGEHQGTGQEGGENGPGVYNVQIFSDFTEGHRILEVKRVVNMYWGIIVNIICHIISTIMPQYIFTALLTSKILWSFDSSSFSDKILLTRDSYSNKTKFY